MKRLLRNSIYVAIIAAILFLASQFYSSLPSSQIKGNAPFEEILSMVEGLTPQEKIARLSSIIQWRYPEAAIAGQYGINPMTETDYVQYEVILQFMRPTDPISYKQVTERKDQILGELSIGTAKLLSVETQIPTIGKNTLNDMVITVTIIYVERTDASNYEMNPEGKAGEFFNPEPFLQPSAEKIAYLFNEARVIQLMKENDVLKWSKYAVPKPHVPALPNTGAIENPKPPIPDK